MPHYHRNPLLARTQKYSLPILSVVIVTLALAGLYLIFRSLAASTNADLNADGIVDIKDLSILAGHFGQTAATFAQGDINGDGRVDIADLSLLAADWGSGSAQPNPIQVSLIPGMLGNYSEDYGPYNSTIFCADHLTSAYDPSIQAYRQYFTYGGADREPMITTRILPNGSWQTPVSLKAVLGNADMIADGHNCLVAAVDSEGYIHVAGNTHAIPMKMAQSVSPFSIASFVNVPVMVDSATEDEFSYPTFFKNADGTLMLAYRNGYLGNKHGRWYLNRWDPTSGSPGHWVRVANITDSQGYSFYPWTIAVDRSNTATKGRIHFFGTWRDDGPESDTPPPNQDLLDFYSDDNGQTWHQYGNPSPMALPIERGDGIPILASDYKGPSNRFILNSGGLDIDSQGRPHALVNMSTTTGTDIPAQYHVWYDGSKWQIDQLTTTGLKPRSSVLTDKDGNTWGFLTAANNNKLLVVNLTPGSPGFEQTNFPLAQDLNFGGSMAAIYDTTLLNEQDELSFMFTQDGGSDSTIQPDANYIQPGYVETIPLNQISAVGAAGISAIPHLVALDNQTTTSKTVTGVDLQKLLNSPVSGSKQVYVKITATAHTSSSTTTLFLKASKTTASGDVSFGQLNFTSPTSTTASTPWLPVQSGSYSGVVSVVAKTNGGSGTGTIDSLKLEVSSFVY